MKRIQNYAAVTVIAALMGSGIPAMAGQYGQDAHHRGEMQYESGDHRGDRERHDNQNREFRNTDRRDDERRTYDRGYRDDRGYGYAAPVYEPAPVYGGPVYEDGYSYRRNHNGRTAAIIGGSAVAGALIGAAAGHGQGAVIGAVIGGIAGAAVSAAADHRR